MAESWRISILTKNNSASVIPVTNTIGATVIRSLRGTEKPILLYPGEEKRALELFGTPSASYPDLFEVLQYIQKYPCWVSAPIKNGKQGGVLITKTGSEALISGLSSAQFASLDFAAIPVIEALGVGDDAQKTFTLSIADDTNYVHQSIDITVNGTSLAVTATDADPEVLSGTGLDSGCSYNRSTGLLTIVFASAPAAGALIKATYDVDRSADAYAIMLDRSSTSDWLSTQIVSTGTSLLTISLFKIESDGTYSEIQNSPYKVSLVVGAKDGFGANIYINDVFTDNDYVETKVNSALAWSTFTDDTTKTDFNGGLRGDAITITELTAGWAYFQSASSYPAKVFFDITCDGGIPALFNTMRTTYQKYSRYLLPLPNANYSSTVATKAGYSINNDGLAFYYGWFKISDVYNNSFAFSNLIGRVAVKHADILAIGFGAYSPSWLDENGMGGQLGSGIISSVYNLTETQLQALDTAQINPIVFDSTYGVMIVSDRTAATTLSDYSYIPHVGLRDYIVENVVNQALPRQITKLNDDFHRTQVYQMVKSILSTTSALLEDFVIKCDRENNNDTVRQQRKFVLQVAVKFITFSQQIVFEFINTPQGVNVKDQLV